MEEEMEEEDMDDDKSDEELLMDISSHDGKRTEAG